MKYFFILGSNPSLSLAELYQVFRFQEKDLVFLSQDVLLVNVREKIDSQEEIRKLGGTIKIGQVVSSAKKHPEKILEIAKPLLGKQEGKLKFGFSFYGQGKLNLKVLGMETKKFLKEQGQSCRWVTSKERVLSSVVVEQNKLTSKGLEIVLIEKGGDVFVGQTEAAQPFKSLSARDYGRPARDDHSGMLPPKLAMIMLNLAMGKKEDIEIAAILDPFCGSGTVLQEAFVLGARNLHGSDISDKAVLDSKKNLDWILRKLQITNYKLQITHLSATELSKEHKNSSIDYIATEPYLGPQRGRIEFSKTVSALNKLYSSAIQEFEKILKPGGRVAMIWPQFVSEKKVFTLAPKLRSFQIVRTLPLFLQDKKIAQESKRKTIVYGRKGQRVWREIVTLEKRT